MPSTETPRQMRPGRAAMRSALRRAMVALVLTAALVAAVDRGARLLGPVLIVGSAVWAGRALYVWWRHLDEEWFAAEIALVAMGWALLASSLAGIQHVAFTLAPHSFYIDFDYGSRIAPRFRAEWVRDSSRVAAELARATEVVRLLQAAPPRLAPDTGYTAGSGAQLRLAERCEVPLVSETCQWQLVLAPTPDSEAIEIPVADPEEPSRVFVRDSLVHQVSRFSGQLERELLEYRHRLAAPAEYVEPRITDFLYDTAIAFSGRDSGVFVPIGALARFFKVLESLASFVLFGIVVSRAAAAGQARAARA